MIFPTNLLNKKNKFKYIFIILVIASIEYKIYKIILKSEKNNKTDLKIALCTMGKKENLYVKEFIDYYLKLGINHIFIYDNNDPDTEKIIDIVDSSYKNKVSIYETLKKNITNQARAFTDCYKNNKKFYNWFLMVDMDEFLFIVNDTLINYLNRSIFDSCDIINFHWVSATDNNLIYYDNRSLFERFKSPYINSQFIKSIVRGNITNLRYGVHSPTFSPEKNITCNNEGKKINYTKISIEYSYPINIKNAYIIHFRYKSTEEFINKYKRGYSNWFENRTKKFLNGILRDYFQLNKKTPEKINFIEKELNLNLSFMKT